MVSYPAKTVTYHNCVAESNRGALNDGGLKRSPAASVWIVYVVGQFISVYWNAGHVYFKTTPFCIYTL